MESITQLVLTKNDLLNAWIGWAEKRHRDPHKPGKEHDPRQYGVKP